MEGDQLVALIGKGGPRVLEVAAHRLLPVEYIARRHAGMAEGGERHLDVMVVLGLHVLADERLAALALRRAGRQLTHARMLDRGREVCEVVVLL